MAVGLRVIFHLLASDIKFWNIVIWDHAHPPSQQINTLHPNKIVYLGLVGVSVIAKGAALAL